LNNTNGTTYQSLVEHAMDDTLGSFDLVVYNLAFYFGSGTTEAESKLAGDVALLNHWARKKRIDTVVQFIDQ